MKRTTAENGTERKKGNLYLTIAAALIFLAGAAIFLYPTVSNYLAKAGQEDAIRAYEQTLEAEDSSFYAEEWKKAREYNDNLTGDPVRDPFLPGTGYGLPQNYMECLNIDGIMGYIEIPKIDLRLPIYHGTDEETLAKGVGHVESTALPIGGDFTHSVLTGHRGLPSARLFTDLDQLEPGDQFYIHVLDEILAYEVDEINTVLPDELDKLMAIPGRDLVTLITCTPYGVNTHRLLVRGSRIPYVPEEADDYRKSVGVVSMLGIDIKLRYIGAAAGVFIILSSAGMIIVIRKRRRKKGEGHDR